MKIDASESTAVLQFIPNPPIDPLRIMQLVQKNKHVRIVGQDRLRAEIKGTDMKARVDAVRALMRSLV